MNSKFERGTPYEIRNIQRPTTMKWQRYTPSPRSPYRTAPGRPR